MIEVPSLVQKILVDTSGFVAAERQSQSFVNNIGSSFGKAGNVIQNTVGVALIAVGGFAIASAKNVSEANRTIQRETGATGKQLESLQGSFKNVAKDAPESFNQVADALVKVHQRTDLTGPALENLTKKFLDLERITGQTIGFDKLQTTMTAFGIKARDIPDALDEIYRATVKTGVPIQRMLVLLQTGGPAFRQFGLNIGQSAALLGIFEKAGVPATLAVIALRREMAQAARDGKKPVEALQEFIEKVQDLVKHGREAEALQLGNKLFGPRGQGLTEAIIDHRITLKDFNNTLTETGVTIDGVAQKTLSFGEQMKIFKNQSELAFAPLGEAILPRLREALEFVIPLLTDAVEFFTSLPAPIVDVTLALGAGAVILTKYGQGLQALFAIIGNGIGLLRDFVKGADAVATATAAGGAAASGGASAIEQAANIGTITAGVSTLTPGQNLLSGLFGQPGAAKASQLAGAAQAESMAKYTAAAKQAQVTNAALSESWLELAAADLAATDANLSEAQSANVVAVAEERVAVAKRLNEEATAEMIVASQALTDAQLEEADAAIASETAQTSALASAAIFVGVVAGLTAVALGVGFVFKEVFGLDQGSALNDFLTGIKEGQKEGQKFGQTLVENAHIIQNGRTPVEQMGDSLAFLRKEQHRLKDEQDSGNLSFDEAVKQYAKNEAAIKVLKEAIAETTKERHKARVEAEAEAAVVGVTIPKNNVLSAESYKQLQKTIADTTSTLGVDFTQALTNLVAEGHLTVDQMNALGDSVKQFSSAVHSSVAAFTSLAGHDFAADQEALGSATDEAAEAQNRLNEALANGDEDAAAKAREDLATATDKLGDAQKRALGLATEAPINVDAFKAFFENTNQRAQEWAQEFTEVINATYTTIDDNGVEHVHHLNDSIIQSFAEAGPAAKPQLDALKQLIDDGQLEWINGTVENTDRYLEVLDDAFRRQVTITAIREGEAAAIRAAVQADTEAGTLTHLQNLVNSTDTKLAEMARDVLTRMLEARGYSSEQIGQIQAYLDGLHGPPPITIPINVAFTLNGQPLPGDAVDQQIAANVLSQYQAAAEGMIVYPRPGGTLINVGEAGSPEVILPTDDPNRAWDLLVQSGLAAQLGPEFNQLFQYLGGKQYELYQFLGGVAAAAGGGGGTPSYIVDGYDTRYPPDLEDGIPDDPWWERNWWQWGDRMTSASNAAAINSYPPSDWRLEYFDLPLPSGYNRPMVRAYPPGYAAGGLTDWPANEARLALLHGQELVLNADQVRALRETPVAQPPPQSTGLPEQANAPAWVRELVATVHTNAGTGSGQMLRDVIINEAQNPRRTGREVVRELHALTYRTRR